MKNLQFYAKINKRTGYFHQDWIFGYFSWIYLNVETAQIKGEIWYFSTFRLSFILIRKQQKTVFLQELTDVWEEP